jgi:hypothetical protein
VLVVIVVILFLQNWRAAIIPIIAIPVSLVGTFGGAERIGFSLNTLTLFGTGARDRHRRRRRHRGGRECRTPLARHERRWRRPTRPWTRSAARCSRSPWCWRGVRADRLHHRHLREFYQQFAVTIAVATAISCFVSLTLSPALAAPAEAAQP